MSDNLKNASQNINGIESINNEYITVMLRLSDDIGIMADRILEVAKMIINNNAQIQLNIVVVEENFNTLLIQLQE